MLVVVVVVDDDNKSSSAKAVVARKICEHKLFERCRRRRNFTSREDDETDRNNDGGETSILLLITFPSMQKSLQFLEQQLFADLQLHEMCSDSGDDARRRRHVLPSLLPSNEAVKEAEDATSILSIIDDLSIVVTVN